MPKKLRKLFLFVLTVVFVVVGAYLFLTANGLVVNWKNWPRLSITKTGDIALKFSPAEAQIKINQKPYHVNKGLFPGDILISKLTPGDYQIEIVKEGYQSWQKTLKVKPREVTSATHIRLFPSSPSWQSPLSEEIKDFWLTGEGLIYQTKKNELRFNQFYLKGNKVILSSSQSKLIITADTFDNYFLTNLEKPATAINFNELFTSLREQLKSTDSSLIKKTYFHPFSPTKIIIATANAFYALDVEKIKLEFLTRLAQFKTASISSSELFFVNKKGDLNIFNLVLKTADIKAFHLQNISFLKIAPDGTKIGFLTSEGEFLIFNRLNNELKSLTKEIKDFYFSPEGKRVFLISLNNKTFIFYLDNYETDNYKNSAGDILTIDFLQAQTFNQFNWLSDYPNNFLILADNELIVSETDPRPPLNWQVLESGVKKYSFADGKIYLLKEEGKFLQGNEIFL